MCNTAYFNEALPMQGGEVSIVSSIAFSLVGWIATCGYIIALQVLFMKSQKAKGLKTPLDH